MKYKLLMLLMVAGFFSCEDNILGLKSLSEPVEDDFYKNEEELDLALNGVYNSLNLTTDYKIPLMVAMDNGATDIGVSRGVCSAMMNQGQGTQSSTDGGFLTIYSNFYKGIARANALLENMVRAKDIVPEDTYNKIRAQALFIRAYHYMYLTELWGDVPYLDKAVKNSSEGLVPRESKKVIADNILKDLKEAATVLPYSWEDQPERITKGAALGLYARIALYNGYYDEAAKSAKQIIDNETEFGYNLYPNYEGLFQLEGQSSSEIMFIMPFKYEYGFTQFSVTQGSRNKGAVSVMVPTQSMIDSYGVVMELPVFIIDNRTIPFMQDLIQHRDEEIKVRLVGANREMEFVLTQAMKDGIIGLYDRYVMAGGTRQENMDLITQGNTVNVEVRKVIFQ